LALSKKFWLHLLFTVGNPWGENSNGKEAKKEIRRKRRERRGGTAIRVGQLRRCLIPRLVSYEDGPSSIPTARMGLLHGFLFLELPNVAAGQGSPK
jgi:hypothetical protein